jgi:hypothetical protein
MLRRDLRAPAALHEFTLLFLPTGSQARVLGFVRDYCKVDQVSPDGHCSATAVTVLNLDQLNKGNFR